MQNTQRHQTVIIGAGQAGLSVAYHLKRRGLPVLLLDKNNRVGDSWRQRWDSLRLFTAARYDGLDGMPFPGPDFAFPTKNEMADYLESYAARFELPVRTGVRVERVSWRDDRFVMEANGQRIEADNLVVAMAKYQQPAVPSFASDLDPRITQLHSCEYQKPSQLNAGDVLIVGAGNSGAEIGVEVGRSHHTWISGRDVGELPFRMEGTASRLFLSRLLLRFVFHRVLTTSTPMGRKLRPKVLFIGGPLIRTKSSHLAAVGIERVVRLAGVHDGLPQLEDGRVLEVANVIWCNGFQPGFSWIDLPIFDDHGLPLHERGIVMQRPGLYFVGLHFLYAMSSTMIHGVGRDADYIAGAIAARSGQGPRKRMARALTKAAAF